MTQSSQINRITRTSLVFLVPFLSLIYDSLRHVYVTLAYGGGTDFIIVVAVILPLIGALAVWRGGRLGYSIALFASLINLLAEGVQAYNAFSSVTVTDYFLLFVTGVPTLLASLIYCIFGLIAQFRLHRGIVSTPVLLSARVTKMISASSVVILLVLGFILGGVIIGSIAAQTELGLVHANPASSANIVIVQGASSSSNGQFYSPSTYTVTVGTTVTWVNHDGYTHSVTSNSGLFDSGPMPPGASFSYTFTKPGTYHYSCTYHPWMTGTIIVTSG